MVEITAKNILTVLGTVIVGTLLYNKYPTITWRQPKHMGAAKTHPTQLTTTEEYETITETTTQFLEATTQFLEATTQFLEATTDEFDENTTEFDEATTEYLETTTMYEYESPRIIETSVVVRGNNTIPSFPALPHKTTVGEYELVHYLLAVETKIPTSYTGNLVMHVRITADMESFTLLATNNLEVSEAEFIFPGHRVPAPLELTKFKTDVFPGEHLIVLSPRPQDGVFYNGTTYRIQVNFIGTFFGSQKDLYISEYPGVKAIGRYAVTTFGNTSRNPLMSLYGSETRSPLEANFTIRDIGHHHTLQSPTKMLAFAENAARKDTVPPSMYSSFISTFTAEDTNDGYTVYYPERLNFNTNAFLALNTGHLVVANLRKYFTNQPAHVDCVILPNLEPNVVDAWGIIYYQGAETIDGIKLHDLLLMYTSEVTGQTKFGAFKPSLKAIHEALLVVAKANIEQCLGYEWFLAQMEGRHELSTQFALVDFLKYLEIGKIYENYHSMDMQYLDFVQQFLWRNVYGLGQFSTSPNEKNYFNNLRLVSLFRMIHDFLESAEISSFAHENFDKFLTPILTGFSTNLITHEEIFEAMKDRMNSLLDTNLTKPNEWLSTYKEFPVVEISKGDNRVITFSATKEDGSLAINWNIPIILKYCQRVENEEDYYFGNLYLDIDGTISVTYPTLSSGYANETSNYKTIRWMLANPGQSVMYRVAYHSVMWNALAAKMQKPNFGEIHRINRAQLIDDSMTLFIQGRIIDAEVPFNVVKYLVNETELLPWAVASRHFKFWYQRTKPMKIGSIYQAFVAKLVKPLYNRLGTLDKGSKEHISTKKLRSIAIDLACMVGNQNCIGQVNTIVGRAIKNPYKLLESNTRDAVCCAALRAGSTTLLKSILSRIAKNSKNLEWNKIEIDLARTQDSDELSFYVRCITCNSVLEFVPLYAKIFFELDKGVYKLPLQEYFRENVQFTNYPLMKAFKVLRDSKYAMEARSMVRWLAIAVTQVSNDFESRTIGQTLSDLYPRRPSTYGSYMRLKPLDQAPKIPESERDTLKKISREMHSLLRQLDSFFSNFLMESVNESLKKE